MRVIDLDTGKEFFLDATPEFKLDFEKTYTCCSHSRKELRQKRNRGGAIQYIDQCLDCGTSVGMFQKHMPSLANSPLWDHQLQERYFAERERLKVEITQKHVRLQRDKLTGRQRRYEEYLHSDAWALKRAKVLKRANGQCEGCSDQKATQIHHLTYKNIFNEFLFQLVAVCPECHAGLHAEKIFFEDENLAWEWGDNFPCNACRCSTEEGNRKWCSKFDMLALAALASDGECGPNHKQLELLK